MGTCHSRQPAVVIADNKPRKPTVEHCKGSDPGTDASTTPSLTSSANGMARESSEIVDGGCHAHYHLESEPVAEESFPANISDVHLPPQLESDSSCPLKVSRHKRNESLVKDYLQAEGASSNRIMIQIETPFGLPIEDVYDGVHTGDVLGEGIAGKVRLITHRDTGIQRALKRLDLGLVTSDDDLDRLLDEIKIMCQLDHPNVITLEEVFEGENELFLTQELCTGGDLFDRLDEQPNIRYTEAGCAKLIKQIVSSVSYLHSKDIIHRDLKLENFLFQDKSEECELKMIDFGLSKHFVKGEVLHETVGTPYTVAPEVLLGNGYDAKCDVWAIGVITYLLLSGETPFGGDCEGEDLSQVRRNILSGHVSFDDEVWQTVSEGAIGFIKSLLVLNPEQRPSSSELKNHPWLKSMKRNSSVSSEDSHLSDKVVNGLVSFKNLGNTRKFLREIISYTLQPEQIAGLHEEFGKIDVDDKGEISLSCFKEALIASSEDHPFTEVEIEEIFNGLKVRGDTDMSIRWHEFIAACLSQCHIDDRNIRLAFDRLDTERKGYITLSDLRSAMDFYGSDSGHELQSLWINNIIDYKSDKENMTYDDFYKLLTLDKDRDYATPTQALIKSASPRPARIALAQSLTNTESSHSGLDEDTLKFLTSQIEEEACGNQRHQCRRHHSIMGPVRDLGNKEMSLVSDVRLSRNIHDFVLGASRRVEEDNKNNKMSRRVSGRGLLLRRNTQEYSEIPRAHSS